MKKILIFTLFLVVSIGFVRGNVFAVDQDKFTMSQIYTIDAGHSYVGFSIKYMGFAKVRGRFVDFSGTLLYDETDITKTSITFSLKTASIDTDLDFRDRDLKSDNWFDAEKFPEITFQSKRAVKTAGGFDLVGDITIKDVTKEVTLTMDPASGVLKDIRDDTQVIFTGGLTLDRKEYGVSGDNWSRIKEGITGVDAMVNIELSILGKRINAGNFINWVRNVETLQGKIYKTVSENGVEAGIKEFDTMYSQDASSVNWNALNTVGYMLLKEGKVDDAIKIMEHNVSVYPENADLYDSLGEAYGNKGDFEKARKNYEIALEKDPHNINAAEMLRHIK